MRCIFCKVGTTSPGKTTVTLERGRTIVVVRDVPAKICKTCGESYFSSQTTESVLARADKAATNGAEVQILRYPA